MGWELAMVVVGTSCCDRGERWITWRTSSVLTLPRLLECWVK